MVNRKQKFSTFYQKPNKLVRQIFSPANLSLVEWKEKSSHYSHFHGALQAEIQESERYKSLPSAWAPQKSQVSQLR